MGSGAARKGAILDECGKALVSKRQELLKRLDAYRTEMIVDREEDDEVGVVQQALVRELAYVGMENDIRTLAEVELSLRRLKNGQYGRCGSCGGEIAAARLQAIPWTHVCVDCAVGGLKRSESHSRGIPRNNLMLPTK